jgi:hypothetical protein
MNNPITERDTSALSRLTQAWERFTDLLAIDEALPYLGRAEVTDALLTRSMIEDAFESVGEPDLLAQVKRADHAYEARATVLSELADLPIATEQHPVTHWWWRRGAVVA